MLSALDTYRIEAIAKDVLISLYGSLDEVSLPVDLQDLLEAYDLLLKTGEFKDKEISGMYDKDENTIYVAKNEPYQRQSFTIAHELGHYFLHDKKVRDIFYRKQIANLSNESQKDEAEANWFAASLLMPDRQFKEYWQQTHDQDALVTIFGVSPVAVYYRLKNMGAIT